VEHLHHFKLGEDPFRNEPALKFLFESHQQQEALLRLDRAVRQAKGLCVLLGDVGAGKTMVVRQLLDNLEEEVFEASMMVVLNGAADAAWMLARFARQLGVEEPPAEREALIAEIYDRLAIIREDGRHAVLMIDDAQALVSPETLSTVCGLLKLEYEDRRLLTLVLSGTPELGEALASNPALTHRVDAKVRLESFDATTAAAYINHRVRTAGGGPAVFAADALNALHELGAGIPGLMNTLADNALFEAFLCGRGAVTGVDVERAHRDLGWESTPAQSPADERGVPVAAVTPVPDPVMGAGPSSALETLDSELETVFEPTPEAEATIAFNPDSPGAFSSFHAARIPDDGPPKDDSEDLFVELLDD